MHVTFMCACEFALLTSSLLQSQKQPGEIVPCSDCIFPSSIDTQKRKIMNKIFFTLKVVSGLECDFVKKCINATFPLPYDKQ